MIYRIHVAGLYALAVVGCAASMKTIVVSPATINVNGRSAASYSVTQADGTWGYIGTKGEKFRARVVNNTDMPISMHWHGLIVPNDQDGVPGITQESAIAPGGSQSFEFPIVQSGTYWMHPHYGWGVQRQLSAPLILRDSNDPYDNAQSVVMFLSDFSFTAPQTINANLISGSMNGDMKAGMNAGMSGGMKGGAMAGPDLNDVKYDAILTNGNTLAKPSIATVQPGKPVRLRIIDGSAATNYIINLGNLVGNAIATDGQSIKPVGDSKFSITDGQRLDVIVDIPDTPGASYPILAQVEGTTLQSGLVLATPGAQPLTLSDRANTPAGTVDPLQDLRFTATLPFPQKAITHRLAASLDGKMQGYKWFINDQSWPKVTPLEVHKGERIEVTLVNKTSMGHPMHLHGHEFQVTSVNGQTISNGPQRDTVYVPANGTVTFVFDADNSGVWMFHCHILYHSENGMMTVVKYDTVPTPAMLQ